jgi:predicted ATPase/DNA-binding SARP family transcriptional activator
MGLRLFLLGPMRAYADEAAIKLPPRSRLPSLWAHLLLHRQRPLPRHLLAYTFWPDESEEEARLNLRRHLHRLLQLLPPTAAERPWVLSDRSTLQWNSWADAWLDVEEFERLSATPAQRVDAVGLYAGDLLEGLYDDWVFAERERLRDLYAQDLQHLISQAEQSLDFRQAIPWAQRLLRHDPLREQTYRTLMHLHARSGDRAGVVRYFHACTTVLQRELHVDPSAETRQAYEESLAQEGPARGAPSTRVEPAPVGRHNLPPQLTTFVGREQELDEVRAWLSSARLLTLTGMGGVGKTRLALAAAESVAGRFPDGVWWVDLEPLADASLVSQAIAASMGLREQSTRPMTLALAEAVRSKEALLVLDNCEPFVEECARLVESLLGEGAGMRFLATSAEPLGVPGEMVWQVPPLRLPAQEESDGGVDSGSDEALRAPSVRLFVDRAAAALPTFRVTPGNRLAVIRLCRALDGIPLALELAAARLNLMTVEQLVERLDDRFRLLTGGSRTALPRHRTLRAILDWSYGLLSNPERALFRRLSLFVGGFTLESAEAVCVGPPITREQVLQVLSELVDKSLVIVSRPEPSHARYRLLETVGHYAREKLVEFGEAADVRRAFTEHVVGIVEQAGERLLRGPDEGKWFWVIGQEYDNLRGIMSYAESLGDTVTMARVAGWIWPFWWTHGYVAEGRQWLQSLLARRASLPDDLRARVLHAAGRLMVLQGDYDAAASALEESLSVSRELGDLAGTADSLSSLGMVASYRQDHDAADRIWSEALAAYEAQADLWGIGRALNNLGDLAVYRGEYAVAQERLTKSVGVFRELKSTLGESISLINLGRAAFLLGDTAQAAGFFRDSLALKVALADKEGIAWNLEGLAGVASALKRPERAARLYGAAAALREAIGIPVPGPDVPLYERIISEARAQLDPPDWERCWLEGAGMLSEQVLPYALGDDA